MLLLTAPAVAHVATSPAPEAVSVTIYRAPQRPAAQAIDLNWLNGYALIAETRRVAIPAGDGEIRFEGVAGGIMPESAIITGLPDGVVEKNQDAWLLSPASLLDRSLGRRVHIRRTSQATGEVREHEAVIRSGKDGAVVLQTEQGFEALRCSGLSETIVYPEVPAGLSARPTLSVRTRSPRAASATVTLSYLATGFDWQANYIGTLNPAGDRLHLFGWVTLANGDETSFISASAQTVAGRVKREEQGHRVRPRGEPLNLHCWPAGTTTWPPEGYGESRAGGPPPPPSAPPPPLIAVSVTGSRMVQAQQEELGDLKLYRIPMPVTVAAHSQKQVALLEREGVKVQARYRHTVSLSQPPEPVAARRVLTTRNRAAEGLGLPLPAGRLVLFGAGRERPILLGEGHVDDKAIGEDVEIEVAQAGGVWTRLVRLPGSTDRSGEFELTATNDSARPALLEVEFVDRGIASASRLGRRNGRPLWTVTVPPNGSATLRFTGRPEA